MELHQIAACGFPWCGHVSLSSTAGLIGSGFEVRNSFEPKAQKKKKNHGVQDQDKQK